MLCGDTMQRSHIVKLIFVSNCLDNGVRLRSYVDAAQGALAKFVQTHGGLGCHIQVLYNILLIM